MGLLPPYTLRGRNCRNPGDRSPLQMDNRITSMLIMIIDHDDNDDDDPINPNHSNPCYTIHYTLLSHKISLNTSSSPYLYSYSRWTTLVSALIHCCSWLSTHCAQYPRFMESQGYCQLPSRILHSSHRIETNHKGSTGKSTCNSTLFDRSTIVGRRDLSQVRTIKVATYW